MKYIATIILAFLVFAGLCYSAYQHFPRTITVTYTVTHMVPEQRTRIEKHTVIVDGKSVEVDVPITETFSSPPVFEQKERQIHPTPIQQLQFYCLAGVAVIFGIYVLVVIGLFARDKITRQASSVDTRDTRHRMDGVSAFCVGILVGLIGGHGIESQPMYSDAPQENAIGEPVPTLDYPPPPPVFEAPSQFRETQKSEPTTPIESKSSDKQSMQ
jgi:hypothetical protein